MGAQGTATIDFGAYPGKAHATVVVSGLTGILATSLVEPFFVIDSTAQHNIDEHKVAPLLMDLAYSDIVAGTSITIHAFSRRNLLSGSFKIGWVWNGVS